MGTVSENITKSTIAYALTQPIDCQRICDDIQELIVAYHNADPSLDKILVITIKTISDSIVSPPALEYNGGSPS